MNKEQKCVDFLFEKLYTQYNRYNYFKSIQMPFNSTRLSDETEILNKHIEEYKNFYKNMIENIKTKLEEIHYNNITSYLTYDVNYYNDQHSIRKKEINTYLANLDKYDIETLLNKSIASVSPTIDYLTPEYIFTPTLVGLLKQKVVF